MTDWQPIETAPKDGTKIIGWESSAEVKVISWWSGERCAAAEGGEPEDYQEGWYDDLGDPLTPRFWIPYATPIGPLK